MGVRCVKNSRPSLRAGHGRVKKFGACKAASFAEYCSHLERHPEMNRSTGSWFLDFSELCALDVGQSAS